MMKAIETLKNEISSLKTDLQSIELLLKQMEKANARFGDALFSKVARRDDEVCLYGEHWYVVSSYDGNVILISKNIVGNIEKENLEDAKKFCRRLDDFSLEYVSKISKHSIKLHTKVRSCKECDIFLNTGSLPHRYQLIMRGDPINGHAPVVWYANDAYWLASTYEDHFRFRSVSYKEFYYDLPIDYIREDYHHVCVVRKEPKCATTWSSYGTCGVRPVVYLKPGIHTCGKNVNNAWILEEE